MSVHKQRIRFRESHVMFLFRLIMAECIIIAIHTAVAFSQFISSSLLLMDITGKAVATTNLFVLSVISVIELCLIVYISLAWANNEYEISDGAIRHRHGIFSTKEELYSLRNLGSATISQSFTGKIFNFGNIHAYSPILKQEIHIWHVHNPKDIVSHIEDDVEHAGNKHEIFRRT